MALTQSTAPLVDIARVAEQVTRSQRRPDFPIRQALRPLRHTLITLDSVIEALAHFNPTIHIPQIDAPTTPDLLPLPSTSGNNEPLYEVPAAPWTSLSISDSAVSHLVSTFLTVMNPYWRFLEDDLFVRHMRSQDLNSPFCSPLLVNAVLSCGAVRCRLLVHEPSCANGWSRSTPRLTTPLSSLASCSHVASTSTMRHYDYGPSNLSSLRSLMYRQF